MRFFCQFALFFGICFNPLALAEKNTPPLRVGIIAPLSGDFAQFGIGIRRAMQLENEQTTKRAELFFEDNASCQSAEAVTAFQKLSNVNQVNFIITFCTAAAQAILLPAKARAIPIFQLTEPGLDPENYMIKLMPDAAPLLEYLAAALFKKYKKLALVANTMEVNTGPKGNLILFTKAFEKLGGQIVLSTDFPDSELDFRTLLLTISNSKADAVVPFIWPVPQMVAFLKQADDLKLWSKIDLAGTFVFEMLHAQLVEAYPRLAKLDGLESVNLLSETSPAFIEQFQGKFKSVPSQFADYAYDALSIIKRCGNDRACQVKQMQGASGLIEFDSNNRRVGKFALKELQQGNFKVIEIYDQAKLK